MHTYNIDPNIVEKISAVWFDPKWNPDLAIQIMPTTEIALQEELTDRTNIKVYSDGSGIDGKIGSSVVLFRGEVKRKLRYQLGLDKHHTVYEGEGIGMVLGLELMRTERQDRKSVV